MTASRPEQRKDSRSAASLKVKYKSATVAEFIQQFGGDVSQGGIFIKTKSPLAPGALLKLELQLSDASPVIAGVGRVAWRRASSEDAKLPAGMGIKFIKLEPASQQIVAQIVDGRGSSESRFDLDAGAELLRPSQAPEARASGTPAPSAAVPAPSAQVAEQKPKSAPGAHKQEPLARTPVAVAKVSVPPPAPSAAAHAAPHAAPRAAGQARSSAAIPAGLFAQSPLAQAEPRAERAGEGRSSFFPPAPTAQSAEAARTAGASSSGSRSARIKPQAPAAGGWASQGGSAGGPKGVFGDRPETRASISGQLRPAQEVADPGSGLFGDPMLDAPSSEASESNAAIGRRSRPDARIPSDPSMPAPPPAEPSRPPPMSEPNEPSYASTMFASISGKGQAEWEMQSYPPPAQAERGPFSMPPDAHVDELLDDIEAGAEHAPRASTPAANAGSVGVFAPGTPHPKAEDDLVDDLEAEDELLSGLTEEHEEPADELVDPSSLASGPSGPPPMLLDLENTERHPGERKARTRVIALVIMALLLIAGAGALFVQRDLLVQWGVLGGGQTSGSRSTPATTKPASAGPKAEPAAQPEAPEAAEPTQAEAPVVEGPLELIKVNVTSAPRGAELSVDGKTQGTTPTNVELPLGRESRLRVSMAGYAPLEKKVTPARDEPPVRFKLEPLPYELVVRTTPVQAEVSIGSVSAIAPAPLSIGHVVGDVSVSIVKPGFMRMTRPVRLDEFKESQGVMRAEIEVTLSPMPGGAIAPSPSSAAPASQPAQTPWRKPTARKRSGASGATEPTPSEPTEAVAPAEPAAPPAAQASPTGTLSITPSATAAEAKPPQAAPSASTPAAPVEKLVPAPPAPPEP